MNRPVAPMDPAESDLIRGEARVVAVRDGEVVVEAARQPSCVGCAHAGGCGTSAVAGLMGRRPGARLILRNTCDARLGDVVVIGVPRASLLWAALVGYGVPVAGLAAGALVAVGLSGGDTAALLGAAAGLAAGLAAGRSLARRHDQALRPVLLGAHGNEPGCGRG